MLIKIRLNIFLSAITLLSLLPYMKEKYTYIIHYTDIDEAGNLIKKYFATKCKKDFAGFFKKGAYLVDAWFDGKWESSYKGTMIFRYLIPKMIQKGKPKTK